MKDVLRTRIGALPNQWQDRVALRSLELNWIAFDSAGVECIVENCPLLHTLLLDCCEYWTDDVVVCIMEGLHELRHFRLKASNWLSDGALITLTGAAHRFVSLEVQPSYLMSRYSLDQLRQRLSPSSSGLSQFPSAAAVVFSSLAAPETGDRGALRQLPSEQEEQERLSACRGPEFPERRRCPIDVGW